jgi:uncharacterized glyoxalase superfamily protein PhnB
MPKVSRHLTPRARIKHSQLSHGGGTILGNMPWGARFGMLTDKFSIQWILNCNLPG